MAVQIITDSASDIVDFDHPNLTVVPLTIAFGSTVYHDGVDLTHQRFYELLVESDELPSTGAPAPGAFADAYDAAEQAGREVVVVTLSSKLSSTYESACIAAEGRPNVHVVDSLSACIGERILVERALMMAEKNLPAAQIAQSLEQARGKVRVISLFDTLEYLKRGGRISAAKAGVGALLSIKPVISMVDGEIVVLGKARGSKNGRNQLVQMVQANKVDWYQPFALGYTGLSDALLRKYINDSRPLWEGMVDGLPVSTIGGTIGTHSGPGAIAFAYFEKD